MQLCIGKIISIKLIKSICQELVRFRAYYRIKPHAPPLVQAPASSFEFQSCDRTPQAEFLTR
jgi:hypothetical protein